MRGRVRPGIPEGAPVSLIEPKIDDLLNQVDSKYTLVIMAAKRARQINSYYTQLGEGIGEFVPPLVPSDPGRKPLSIALEEIHEQKVAYERIQEGFK
ncbi:MAG: DNA-directed RNA polymerase subunit omega [Actinomycetota bacterium]